MRQSPGRWKCASPPSCQLFFGSDPSQVPTLFVRCHSHRVFVCRVHRVGLLCTWIVSSLCLRYVRTAKHDTVPTHEPHYFATKVEKFKVPQRCILKTTSSILNRRWNWVHVLCDEKWPQLRVAPPPSFLPPSPSLMVQIHRGQFFWKIKFHCFFSVKQ